MAHIRRNPAETRPVREPLSPTASAVLDAWRAKIKASFGQEGEDHWRETGSDGWAACWDSIAKQFREALPVEIEQARELEEFVTGLRRATEMAYVDGNRSDAEEIGSVVNRLDRAADIVRGLPRDRQKRRELMFMRFLEACVDADLTAWPDFDELSNYEATSLGREHPIPSLGAIPTTLSADDAEYVGRRPGEEWIRIVFLEPLRAALGAVGDIRHVSKEDRDRLVKAWREKGPGAKASDSSTAKVSAYELLHRVLKKVSSDANVSTPKQLKTDLSKAKMRPSRK